MSITFGGLASGLDTESIIEALMGIERAPLKKLETEKDYLTSRLKAFSQFEEKLDALASAIADMDSPNELGSFAATAGTDEYFAVSVENSSLAAEGSFQLEVVNLAQVQKDVSVGYAESDTPIFSGGTITINGTDITIDEDSSLNTIRDAINDANETEDTGVSASVIFDGSNYRLVLTGQDADTSFTATATGISDGTTTLSFSNTQAAESAEVVIDGITITSNTNTISNAIPGVSIDLLKENNPGESTTVNVETDFTDLKAKLDSFVSAYNDINNFIKDQSDADWAHDPSFRAVENKLQDLLVSDSGASGTFKYLVDIGFKSDSKTGELSINTARLDEILNDDYENIEQMLLGGNGSTGILSQFNTYLDGWTDTINGLYAGKKQSYDSSIKSINSSIERTELRLEKREELLMMQFAAMEEIVNSMNATSSYLAQQISSMPTSTS